MHDLEKRVKSLVAHSNVPALEKVREELVQLVEEVSDLVESKLDKGLSPHRDRKNLSEAHAMLGKVQDAIDSIIRKKQPGVPTNSL